MKKKINKKEEEEDHDSYCPRCGHCGFIGCCGITDFLKKHVLDKTDCLQEEMVLNDLITRINETLPEEMQQDYLRKCPQCKSNKCSGWHKVKLK